MLKLSRMPHFAHSRESSCALEAVEAKITERNRKRFTLIIVQKSRLLFSIPTKLKEHSSKVDTSFGKFRKQAFSIVPL